MAADLTRDRIYFVRASDGIWLNYSQDKGKMWSTNIRVDMFINSSASHAMIPSAAVNKNGVLGISWVDKQTDPDKTDVWSDSRTGVFQLQTCNVSAR